MCRSVRKAGEGFISGEERPADLTIPGWKQLFVHAHWNCIMPARVRSLKTVFESTPWERHSEPHLRGEDTESWKDLKCAHNHSWRVASTRFKSSQTDGKCSLNSTWQCPDSIGAIFCTVTEYQGLNEIGLVGCTERLNKIKQKACILQVPNTVHLWVQGAEKGQKPVKKEKKKEVVGVRISDKLRQVLLRYRREFGTLP